MIDRDYELSVSRQAKALGISRGSVYYLSQPTSAANLALMRQMDELHLEHPLAGSRMLKGLLQAEGHQVGRQHVSALMREWASRRSTAAPTPRSPASDQLGMPF
jgi:putative transposase